MPIAVQIDHARKLVVATVTGDVCDDELLEYQKNVWSDTALAGYSELFDVTAVRSISGVTAAGLGAVAQCAASMDVPGKRSRFAIVAPQDLPYGMGRMYEALRTEIPGSVRSVAVFRSRDEAEAWLGCKKD